MYPPTKSDRLISSSAHPAAAPVGDGPLWKTDEKITAMMDPNSPAPKLQYPEWQHEYQAALLELDPQRLKERLEAAEAAIFKRLQSISHSADESAERQAIEDAVSGLRVLKRDRLNFPDWEKK